MRTTIEKMKLWLDPTVSVVVSERYPDESLDDIIEQTKKAWGRCYVSDIEEGEL